MGFFKDLDITLMNAEPMSPRTESYYLEKISKSKDFQVELERYYQRRKTKENIEDNYKSYQKKYKKENVEKLKHYNHDYYIQHKNIIRQRQYDYYLNKKQLTN
jgi:replicative superfamily II helicase